MDSNLTMLLVRMPDNLQAERAHAARLVFTTLLGIEHAVEFEARADVAVHLAEQSELCVCMPDILFASGAAGWPRAVSRPPDVPPRFFAAWPGGDTSVPVLFGRPSTAGQWWEQQATGRYFGVDVLGTAFWMMTQLEELVDGTRDLHDRFPGRRAHAVRADYIDRPIVDETVRLLLCALQQVWPNIAARTGRHAVVLTHDVDRPFKHLFQSPARLLRSMAADAVRRRGLRQVIAAPGRWVRVRRGLEEADPFFTFDWLMDQSERAGLRSTFFFICGHSGGSLDGDYELQHPRIRALLKRIHSRGHEIGVHGSYNTFRSTDTLRRELRTLQSVCEQEGIIQDRWGVRQHVLRFDSRVTPAVWDSAGLSFDTTLGFADVTGFRCGTCHPYPLYDHQGRRTLKVIERPLVVMDVTLMNAGYEGRTPEQALARIETLREACRRVAGEFVMLWHNCHLTAPSWRAVYAKAQSMPVTSR
jgi:hypothetical protein